VITCKPNVTINIPKKYHLILVELTKMMNFPIELIQIFKKGINGVMTNIHLDYTVILSSLRSNFNSYC
jgi:hypothetical protein